MTHASRGHTAGGPERGSSEDDLARRITGAGGDGEAGSVSTRRKRARTPPTLEYGDVDSCFARAVANPPLSLQRASRSRAGAGARPPCVIGGRAFAASSRSEADGMAQAQLGDLDEVLGQRVEPDGVDRLDLLVCRARAAHEVRLVGVREPVRVRAERGEDGVLLEPQRRVARAREREHVGDRLVALRVGDRVRAPLGDAERHVLAGGDVGDEARALDPARRAARDADRAGPTASPPRGSLRAGRRRAAAGAPDDAFRRLRRAARRMTRARRPRAGPRARARRPRRAAGSASRGRTHGGV